jgi:rod shape-determining protein MreC
MRRFNLFALLVFVGALGWVFTFDTPATREIQGKIMALFSPFTRGGAEVQQRVAASNQPAADSAALKAENDRLALENDRLRLVEQQLAEARAQLAQLNALFKFNQHSNYVLTASRIIVRKNSAWFRQATIDKGSRQGISAGSPVVVPDGLVGRVVKVGLDESEILLVTDELCKVAAQVEGTREWGILEGVRVSTSRRPDLRLRYLPRDIDKSLIGRKVYSLPDYISFPPNILLGTIAEFRAGDYSTEAVIKPAVQNLDRLNYVFVMGLGAEEKPAPPPDPR